jgi:hypothetical protein
MGNLDDSYQPIYEAPVSASESIYQKNKRKIETRYELRPYHGRAYQAIICARY